MLTKRWSYPCGLAVCLLMFFACGQVAVDGKKKREGKTNHVTKPGSSFNDSLTINTAAAVFFEPDSLQMQKIKSVTEEGVFKSTTHEYRYQTKNAHTFLKTHWSKLKIFEAENIRFLVFQKKDKDTIVIDLNKCDPFGLFVFDAQQAPVLIDMMNIESGVPDYFNSKKQSSSRH